jgi:xanthosine utilization system XapX-like protein
MFMSGKSLLRSASPATYTLGIVGILLIIGSLVLSWIWTPGLATTYAWLVADRFMQVAGTSYDQLIPFMAEATCIIALTVVGWAMLCAAIDAFWNPTPGTRKAALQRIAGIAGLVLLVATLGFAAAGFEWAWSATYDLASTPFQLPIHVLPLLPVATGACLGLFLGRTR